MGLLEKHRCCPPKDWERAKRKKNRMEEGGLLRGESVMEKNKLKKEKQRQAKGKARKKKPETSRKERGRGKEEKPHQVIDKDCAVLMKISTCSS